jgi:hypothetical protein
MTLISAFIFVAAVGVGPVAGRGGAAVGQASGAQAAPDCRDWQACRQLALDAASRQDYDTFHDLAWRTLQAGPKNDPALMTLVARAQSLSGRPHDALVMLQRLLAMGVVTDAATNDDFARVRALPAWAEFEAKVNALGVPPTASVPPSSPAAAKPKATPSDTPAAPKVEPAPARTTKAEKSSPESPAVKSPAASTAAAKPAGVPERLSFSGSGLAAVGLGYDAVSGRFLVGDRQERRLVVVGERSGRLASLAGPDAGFSEVTAFVIDTREGDLWVVSTSSQSRTSTIHKLQLISGRVLSSIPLPSELAPSRFTDVAVTPQQILVLDSEGRRVFRVAKKGRTLELAARLAVQDASSLAPATDTAAYAAYDQGLLRIDLSTRNLTVVEAGNGTDLSGLGWIRWHRGSLVGIQKAKDGTFRVVRIHLDDAGRTVKGMDIIDPAAALAGPTSATVSGNTLYYLGRVSDADLEVRKVVLK